MTDIPEINYLDSFSANTTVVPNVIDNLIDDLNRMFYPKEEMEEIILSMDEAITNAIQETVQQQENLPIHSNQGRREITVRYTINSESFDATIIDHGKGFDISSLERLTPDINSCNYFDQVVSYAQASESKRLKVRLNGEEITLKGIGAGLKIILAFMDSITIDLIDKKCTLSDSVTQFTDGTILNMKRKRRYNNDPKGS